MTSTSFLHLSERSCSCQGHRTRDYGAVFDRLCVFIGYPNEALEKRFVMCTFTGWRKRDNGIAVRVLPGAPLDVRDMFPTVIDFLLRTAVLPNTWLLNELNTAERSWRLDGTGTTA